VHQGRAAQYLPCAHSESEEVLLAALPGGDQGHTSTAQHKGVVLAIWAAEWILLHKGTIAPCYAVL